MSQNHEHYLLVLVTSRGADGQLRAAVGHVTGCAECQRRLIRLVVEVLRIIWDPHRFALFVLFFFLKTDEEERRAAFAHARECLNCRSFAHEMRTKFPWLFSGTSG